MINWGNFNLQNILSINNSSMDLFHDLTLFILMMILIGVLTQLVCLSLNKSMSLLVVDNMILETTWTIIPGIILIFLGVPSLHMLYLTEANMSNSAMAMKVIGHQWFWSYEISNTIDFNSYMLPTDSLDTGCFRLLEVDNKLVVPVKMSIRFMMTSTDVIHSWAVPSMGVKMDCTPGRLNQLVVSFPMTSIFYGQCSEICGANHSFMPICIEVSTLAWFVEWLNSVSLTK